MNAPVSAPATSPSRSGMLAFALVLAAFITYVWVKSAELPAIVATHFDWHGKANGWMTREKHLWFTIGLGTLTPLFIMAMFAFIRRREGWGLNIPNKAYWLAPERRTATFDHLSRQGLWLAILMVVFQAAIFRSVLDANQLRPPVLATNQTAGLTGGLLALTAIWIAGLLLHFRRPSA